MNKNTQTLKETFVEALKNFKKKDFKSAEISCYKILSINTNHTDSIFLLATISAIQHNFMKAKEFMLKLVELDPSNKSYLNNLGTAYKELGNLKEAENTYKRILKIDSQHTNANYNLGLIFYQLKQLEIAKSYFQKTVDIQKNYALAFCSLANVHAELKETNEAISCYQKAIEINPTLVSAHNNLGLLYRELNDFKNAIDCYQKAINAKSDHASSYHNLALANKEIGDFKKSISSHELAIKYEPKNLMHYYFLSELKKDILNNDLKNKVEKILLNNKSTLTNDAYGNYLLAKFERKEKNYEKEIKYLKKGHESFYNSQKEKFDLNNKYCFEDVLQIMESAKLEKSQTNNQNKINPIFIFGVPRCGSTLIERVISSGLELIPVGEETGILGHFIRTKVLEKQSLTLGTADELRGELYKIYKEKGLISKKCKYKFTDKSLDNFFYINVIKELYPNAKIVNCKRNLHSSIMSIFQNNITGLAWTHNLESIFKYFDNYLEIMEKFKKKYPKFIYELELEKFISNPKEESKKLMSFCDLPWDIKCLEFYKRKDLFSKTASNVQIRGAIFQQPSDKYLPYKKYINDVGKKYSWFN